MTKMTKMTKMAKKIKRLYFLPFLAVMLTVLLSGCIQMYVNIGIEDDFTAYLIYDITINMDVDEYGFEYEDGLAHALNQIGWHYQEEMGFEVYLHTDDFPFRLTLTRRVQNDTLEQAFLALEEMLTDEAMSMFMEVDIAFESFDRQDKYLLGAMIDIPQIMRLSSIEEMTPATEELITEAVENSEGLISISLPASETIGTSHPVTITNDRVETLILINFMDQTRFELEARVTYLRDGTIGPPMEEIVQQQQLWGNISAIAIGVAMLLLVIALIAAIVRAVRLRRD